MRAPRAFQALLGPINTYTRPQEGSVQFPLLKISAKKLKGQYRVKTYTLDFCTELCNPPPLLALYKFGNFAKQDFSILLHNFWTNQNKAWKMLNPVSPTFFYLIEVIYIYSGTSRTGVYCYNSILWKYVHLCWWGLKYHKLYPFETTRAKQHSSTPFQHFYLGEINVNVIIQLKVHQEADAPIIGIFNDLV